MDPVGTLIKGIQQASRTSARWKVEYSKAVSDVEGDARTLFDRHVNKIRAEKMKIWALEKQMKSVGAVVNDKKYQSCMDIYRKLQTHSKSVIGELDDFDAALAKKELERDRMFISLRRKSKETRGQMTELNKSSAKSEKALQRWWRELSADGTTGVPIDPECTDIMTKVKKNQTIAMPPKQSFRGHVKFENVPKFVESDFRGDASKFLKRNVNSGLKNVRKLVATKVEKFNDEFRMADQKGDEKRAKSLFDNFNKFLQKELKPDLEEVVREAAELTVFDLRSTKKQLYKILFENAGTKVGKVNVDVSDFFSVEVVMSDADTDYSDAKDVEGAFSKYQSSAEATRKNLSNLQKFLQDLEREASRDSAKRERLGKSVTSEIDKLSRNFKSLTRDTNNLSTAVNNATREIEKTIQKSKDKTSNKQALQKYSTASKSFKLAIKKALDLKLDGVDWDESEINVDTVKPLRVTMEETVKTADADLALEKNYKGFKEAVDALSGKK